jgi:hypothetical protein
MSKRGRVAKFEIRLSGCERVDLEKMIRIGRDAAYRLLQARILLKADVLKQGDGWRDAQITESLETSLSTVLRTWRQLVEEGLESAWSRKTQSRPHARICRPCQPRDRRSAGGGVRLAEPGPGTSLSYRFSRRSPGKSPRR